MGQMNLFENFFGRRVQVIMKLHMNNQEGPITISGMILDQDAVLTYMGDDEEGPVTMAFKTEDIAFIADESEVQNELQESVDESEVN